MLINVTKEQMEELERSVGVELLVELRDQYVAGGILASKRILVSVPWLGTKVTVKGIMLSDNWAITPEIRDTGGEGEPRVLKSLKALTHIPSGMKAFGNRRAKEIILWWLGIDEDMRKAMNTNDENEMRSIPGFFYELRKMDR